MTESENPYPPPEEKNFKLVKRRNPKDYWQGYRDGLRAAIHGIQKSLDHFDAIAEARAQDENGNN
jgi:hypothetical protein